MNDKVKYCKHVFVCNRDGIKICVSCEVMEVDWNNYKRLLL